VERIVEAQWVADRRRRERFVCEQPQYSIFARSAEVSVLPTCERYGIGVIPWSPLAGGWLTGKYRKGGDVPAGSRYATDSAWARQIGGVDLDEDPRLELVEQLLGIADQAGLSLTHMSLAFVDAHPAITPPIIGVRTPDQLDEALGAADVVLDGDTLDAIDRICLPGVDAPGIRHAVPNPALDAVNRRR
jgi:aryl-alcohol dehydrogenase (NADP+)